MTLSCDMSESNPPNYNEIITWITDQAETTLECKHSIELTYRLDKKYGCNKL